MKTYTCLIIEDEPLAQELIENHLSHFPNIQIIEKFENGIEALTYLSTNEIDILFLDIEMPSLNGINLLKSLKKQPLTIFTTAYSEYALESYNHNVIDYLLKPITFNRFCIAINKVLKILNKETSTSKNEYPEFIFVKSDFKAVKITLDDVLYIEGMQKYIKIHHINGYTTTLMSLSKIIQILNPAIFMRCQKSFIINITKINSIEGNFARIENNFRIPLNKDSKLELIKKIDPDKLLQ